MALALVVSTRAAAQSPPADGSAKADAHYQTAVRLFGEGRYREALDEFDEAIAISPEPIFYCNRAIVLIELREPEDAYQSLETCRDGFTGATEDKAEIDAQMLAVGAFVHHVGPRATQITEDIATGPLVKSTPTPPEHGGFGATDYGLLSTGIGAALVGSAVTLDLLSKPIVDEYKQLSAEGGSQQRYDELKQEILTRQRIWYALSIGGGVFALAGVGLVVYDAISGGDDTEAPVVVLPWVGPAKAGIMVRF